MDDIADAGPAAAAAVTLPLFNQWADVQGDNVETVQDEVDRYIKHNASLPNDGDILHFWKYNENLFPSLARLARNILCVPASSVSCESAFSVTGRTLENRRTCLSTLSVNAIMFLNSNM